MSVLAKIKKWSLIAVILIKDFYLNACKCDCTWFDAHYNHSMSCFYFSWSLGTLLYSTCVICKDAQAAHHATNMNVAQHKDKEFLEAKIFLIINIWI